MTKASIYTQLIELLSPHDGGPCDGVVDNIVVMLCNYFDTNELDNKYIIEDLLIFLSFEK